MRQTLTAMNFKALNFKALNFKAVEIQLSFTCDSTVQPALSAASISTADNSVR
jgi:hypothetical protein